MKYVFVKYQTSHRLSTNEANDLVDRNRGMRPIIACPVLGRPTVRLRT